jgi:hypothetical protein
MTAKSTAALREIHAAVLKTRPPATAKRPNQQSGWYRRSRGKNVLPRSGIEYIWNALHFRNLLAFSVPKFFYRFEVHAKQLGRQFESLGDFQAFYAMTAKVNLKNRFGN